MYESSGPIWPVRCLPATAFPRGSAARDRDSAKAWSFFERVEAYDADVRVRLSGTGWTPNGSSCSSGPWYKFATASELTLYRRGQILHTQLCPGRNWTSQRHLGISSEPLEDVYPDVCPNYEQPEMDPVTLFVTDNRGSPTLSAVRGSTRDIKSLGHSTNASSKNNSRKGSRRGSVSQ